MEEENTTEPERLEAPRIAVLTLNICALATLFALQKIYSGSSDLYEQKAGKILKNFSDILQNIIAKDWDAVFPACETDPAEKPSPKAKPRRKPKHKQ